MNPCPLRHVFITKYERWHQTKSRNIFTYRMFLVFGFVCKMYDLVKVLSRLQSSHGSLLGFCPIILTELVELTQLIQLFSSDHKLWGWYELWRSPIFFLISLLISFDFSLCLKWVSKWDQRCVCNYSNVVNKPINVSKATSFGVSQLI